MPHHFFVKTSNSYSLFLLPPFHNQNYHKQFTHKHSFLPPLPRSLLLFPSAHKPAWASANTDSRTDATKAPTHTNDRTTPIHSLVPTIYNRTYALSIHLSLFRHDHNPAWASASIDSRTDATKAPTHANDLNTPTHSLVPTIYKSTYAKRSAKNNVQSLEATCASNFKTCAVRHEKEKYANASQLLACAAVAL